MAEITQKKFEKEKYKTMSKTDFALQVGGVSSQAIDYAIENDMVDFMFIGSHRVIVLTEKTNLYTPNKNKKRAILRT